MSERIRTLAGHIRGAADHRIITQPTSSLVDRKEKHQLKYTLDGDILTSEQRLHYEENGFLVVKKCISGEQLNNYRNRFQEICAKQIKVPGMTMMKDVAIVKSEFTVGEQAVTKVQDFQNDDQLFEYCCEPEVLRYVSEFVGPDIMAMHTMLINKPPDPGTLTSRHPMHQDLHYFPFRPVDRIVCAWTAMQHIHQGNGCLVVLPGTHKGDILEHGYPKWENGVNKMYHGIMNYNPDMPRVHLEMETGDTVFFHPLLIHGSGTNRTNGFRKAISCHYASSHCNYIDVTGTTQAILEDEIRGIAKKRYGDDLKLDFKDVWSMKARCVQGTTGNL